MDVVKLTNKDELDQLVASLTLRLGKNIPQQQVIEACIKLSITHISELEKHFSTKQMISQNRFQEIIDMADNFEYDTTKTIDEKIYGV